MHPSSAFKPALAVRGLLVAALAIADRLPENAFVQLAYFVIVGTVWFVPMIPLVVWMNWGRWPVKRS